MNRLNNLSQSIMRSPILWGILGAVGFFALIHGGPLDTPFTKRYFTNHPVEYAETVLFAVALAALVLRLLEVMAQYPGLGQSPFGPAGSASAVDDPCRGLLDRLNQLASRRQREYYVGRLRAAVEWVQRQGSADGLSDELKYFADADATRAHNGYALFRVIVWSIPILGFLGTVIGITVALNGLEYDAIDKSMAQVMTGLGMKFDTTALALGASLLLMFVHFFVERAEHSLLEAVDPRVEADLAGRFPKIPEGPEGQVVAMRRMAEVMVQAADRLVQRQAELWQSSMDAAAARWARMADSGGEQLRKAVADGLTESLRAHAERLAAAEQSAAEQNRRHWEKLAQTQGQNLQAMTTIQSGMARQADILTRAVEASGEVMRLEDALNRNLAALAGAKHFEQALHGLAAAIHLLNSRLADVPVDTPAIQLESPRRTSQAA